MIISILSVLLSLGSVYPFAKLTIDTFREVVLVEKEVKLTARVLAFGFLTALIFVVSNAVFVINQAFTQLLLNHQNEAITFRDILIEGLLLLVGLGFLQIKRKPNKQ